MVKMMTYSEANSVLGSSLTPANRCLTKSVAIASGAAEDPLSSYASNRLVPASVVQPAQHDVAEQFFLDENNNRTKQLTITVTPITQEVTYRTIVVLNGEVVKEDPGSQVFPYRNWDYSTRVDPNNIIYFPSSHTTQIDKDTTTGIWTHHVTLNQKDTDGIQCTVNNTVDDQSQYQVDPITLTIKLKNEYEQFFIDQNGNYTTTLTVSVELDALEASYQTVIIENGVNVYKGARPDQGIVFPYNDYHRDEYKFIDPDGMYDNFNSSSQSCNPDYDQSTGIWTHYIKFTRKSTGIETYCSIYNYVRKPTGGDWEEINHIWVTFQRKYKITFREESQFGGDVISEDYYSSGETPIPPTAPQHAGYTHTGWTPTIVPVSSNATYYATYQSVS